MPGIERVSVDGAKEVAKRAADLGIPALAIFPVVDSELKTDAAEEAWNPDNLMCRATRAIDGLGLDLGLVCDVALDPYTSHGQDGLVRDGYVVNDETLEALSSAGSSIKRRSGASVIAPAVMDGRIARDTSGNLDAERRLQHVYIQLLSAPPGMRSASAWPTFGMRWDSEEASVQADKRTISTADPRPTPIEALRESGAAGPRRRRRYGDGQARDAVPGYRASREGDFSGSDRGLPSKWRIRDASCSCSKWLARWRRR